MPRSGRGRGAHGAAEDPGPVRPPAPPAGAGLRLGHDLLAPSGGLGRGRRLGEAAPAAAEQAALEEPAGLVAGGDRLLPRPGRTQGPKSGPSPVDRARPGSKPTSSPTARG